MGPCSRLTLLILSAILGSTPPNRSPGSNDKPTGVATCSKCDTRTTDKLGKRFWCGTCEEWFVPRNTAKPKKN
jgi:hypothetical protein